jgi:predicted nucleotidyltransferase
MATTHAVARLAINRDAVAGYSRRWRIKDLAIFGSALRSDFRPDSDVDILVTFADDAEWSLIDHVQMESELAGIIGRKVDLVSRRAVERSDNWIRRDAILGTAESLFAQG